MQMAPQWLHPNLGTFEFNDLSWAKTIEVPAFKEFSYDTGYSNAPRSNGMHELAFESDDERDHPSEAAISLASAVLENQKELVATVAGALWDDFNGLGPTSGMWWHGDLEAVFEYLDEDPPDTAEGILPLLQVCRIWVRKNEHRHDGPIVELSFHAAFEEEHGVGILTDGKVVLGIGYMIDVTPFR
jgi:hypothetical protein